VTRLSHQKIVTLSTFPFISTILKAEISNSNILDSCSLSFLSAPSAVTMVTVPFIQPLMLPDVQILSQPLANPDEINRGTAITEHALSNPENEKLLDDAVMLASRLKDAMTVLQNAQRIEFELDESNELKALRDHPLSRIHIGDNLFSSLPKRKKQPHGLAEATAALLFPAPTGSLSPVIRYEHECVLIRKWIILQRRYKELLKTKEQEKNVGIDRFKAQGQWNPEKQPISLAGAPALPMPVDISDAHSLGPFFTHLRQNGTSSTISLVSRSAATNFTETFYRTRGLEFPKGVLYDDGRMDLCKKVVGPSHIGPLLESLKTNTFVKHFLLGNNIIGPTGAKHIADFVYEFPDRIDTWYLAGNCIDGPSFSKLVDAFVTSPAISNIWLKRNPLGPYAANDLFRLITETSNLRTLDLDQTELGDAGVTELFSKLAQHQRSTRLEIIYLNGSGIGVAGATAIGKYMASKICSVHSIYMSNNPLSSKGAAALASGLHSNRSLIRLTLASTGISDAGAIHLFAALQDHPTLRVLDVGASFATADLGQAYNYLTDAIAPTLAVLISSVSTLEYLNLGFSPMTHAGLNTIFEAAVESSSLFLLSVRPVSNSGVEYPKHERERYLKLKQELAEHQKGNIKARFGDGMSSDDFYKSERRWVLSDKDSIRKIDSVYRNRDMGLARRGIIKLNKWWDDGDETLAEVASYME
jgi:Ran GTPase-activating protein (RanGAP) involved in mRNA processing and transport